MIFSGRNVRSGGMISWLLLVSTWIFLVRNAQTLAQEAEKGDDYLEEEEDYYYQHFEVECIDKDAGCDAWAQRGECGANPAYMHEHCRQSCRLCHRLSSDHRFVAREFTMYSAEQRGADFGVPQTLRYLDGTKVGDILFLLAKARSYMHYVVDNKKQQLPGKKTECRNRYEDCAYWALTGECSRNPTFMNEMCAPVCGSCHIQNSLDDRCPVDWEKEAPAWQAGDLDRLFRRLTSEPIRSQHAVAILSSPDSNTNGPWILTMENILSEAEVQRLIDIGSELGYKKSFDMGQKLPDGVHDKHNDDGRTASVARCDTPKCDDDPLVQVVHRRLSEMVNISWIHSEGVQLLRYEEGQSDAIHHDFTDHRQDKQGGPRILTVFIFLNDVKEGGATHFDQLDISVLPKRGRAVLWPSVLNDKPWEKDVRMTHQALPVEKGGGTKYAANVWFHMRDVRTPDAAGCPS